MFSSSRPIRPHPRRVPLLLLALLAAASCGDLHDGNTDLAATPTNAYTRTEALTEAEADLAAADPRRVARARCGGGAPPR